MDMDFPILYKRLNNAYTSYKNACTFNITSDFVAWFHSLQGFVRSVKSVGGSGNRTRYPSQTRRRLRPLSHGDYRDLTHLSWYRGGYSIHYNY